MYKTTRRNYQQNKKVHTVLNDSPLPRHLNWIELRQAVWKSIEYVLIATTFTEKECAQISKELYRPLLPKLG